MANFCQSCGHPVRQEKATWVHYDEHITHPITLLADDNATMRKYRQLQHVRWRDMDALFDILMSPDTSDEDRLELLMNASARNGSVCLEDNLHIIPILVKMYARRDELSYMTSGYLEWLVDVQGYPLR